MLANNDADRATPARKTRAGCLIWTATTAVLVVGILLAISVARRQSRTPDEPAKVLANVETITVRPVEYFESLRLPARIKADRQAAVSAEVGGKLAQWLADEGQTVAAGQTVARLDTSTVDAQLRALAVQLQAAAAEVDYAQKDFDRIGALAAADVATAAELETAANDLTQARLTVSRIERERDTLQTTRAKAELPAPIAGRLEEHLREAGEVVAAGQTLARIYDLEFVRATVNLPDRYIPFLDDGTPAIRQYIALARPGAERRVQAKLLMPGLPRLSGEGPENLSFKAEIARVALAADPRSNTFAVELRLPNPGGALKQGMLAQAELSFLRYPQAILIPLQAIQVTDTGPRVLVVEALDGQDVALARPVEVLSIKDDQLFIASGIQPGERLVVAGGKGVIHGEPVNVIMEDGGLQLGLNGTAATENHAADDERPSLP